MSYDMLGRLIEKIMGVPKEYLGTLMTLAEKLAGREGSQTGKELNKFLREESCWVDESSKVGGLAAFLSLQVRVSLDLWFRKRVLIPALRMDGALPVKAGRPLTLLRWMYDSEIRQELGDGHVFENARAFCHFLFGALVSQRDGAEGILFADGSVNLFYVLGLDGEVVSVRVQWSAYTQGWVVDNPGPLDFNGWPPIEPAYHAFPCVPV